MVVIFHMDFIRLCCYRWGEKTPISMVISPQLPIYVRLFIGNIYIYTYIYISPFITIVFVDHLVMGPKNSKEG